MLDIVIPVYNEALNIERCLNELALKVKVPFKVLVVYDFDEDNTLPVIKNIKNGYNFSIILIKNNIGKGPLSAIKAGLNASNGDAVLVSMADLSDDIKIVDDMYRLLINGADIVCGSRYMKGGRQIGNNVAHGKLYIAGKYFFFAFSSFFSNAYAIKRSYYGKRKFILFIGSFCVILCRKFLKTVSRKRRGAF